LLFITNVGDWGLGIGDWAQSPIPNPQSPILSKLLNNKIITSYNLITKFNIN